MTKIIPIILVLVLLVGYSSNNNAESKSMTVIESTTTTAETTVSTTIDNTSAITEKVNPPVSTNYFPDFYEDAFEDIYLESQFSSPSHVKLAKEFLLKSNSLKDNPCYNVSSADDIYFVHGVSYDFEHNGKSESIIEFDFKYNCEMWHPNKLSVFVNENGECTLFEDTHASSEYIVFKYNDFAVLNSFCYSGGTSWSSSLYTIDNGLISQQVGGNYCQKDGPILHWINKYDWNEPYNMIIWDDNSKQYRKIGEEEITKESFFKRVNNADTYLEQAKEIAGAEIEKIYTAAYYWFFFEFTNSNGEKQAVYGSFDGENITFGDICIVGENIYRPDNKDNYYMNYTNNNNLIYGLDYYGIIGTDMPKDKPEIITATDVQDLGEVEVNDNYDNYEVSALNSFKIKYGIFIDDDDDTKYNVRKVKINNKEFYEITSDYEYSNTFLYSDSTSIYLRYAPNKNEYYNMGREEAIIENIENPIDTNIYYIDIGEYYTPLSND